MSLGLDSDQLGVLAAAVERLVPADEHGPGAVELGVVDYIAAAPAGAERAIAWAEGLASLDGAAAARRGCRFAELGPEQRDAILAGLEQGRDPFFELLRDHVLQGMFGDPCHGGNRDGAGWALLSYPGPRRAWSEAEQQLDALPGPDPSIAPGPRSGDA